MGLPVVSQRGFAAAEVNRLVAGWRVDYGYTPQETRNQLPVIRGLSRDLFKNNSHAKNFARWCETNIVGRGFRLKATPMDAPDRIDRAAALELETAFWDWASRPEYCDAEGTKTLAEICRLASKQWPRDGEFVVQMLRGALRDNPYGFALKMLRCDLLDHNLIMQDTGRGTSILCGIERDGHGKPIAFWFRTGTFLANSLTPTGEMRAIPADQIIYGCIEEDSAQCRGFPWGHSCMLKLKMIELYDLAELTAARDEACSVRTYFAPRGQEDEIADITEDDGVAGALTAPKEPGQSEVLPIGWQQQVHTPQHPNTAHNEFKKDGLREVASGYGVGYPTWANDLEGVSYSSIRAGTLAERDTAMVLQDRMADVLLSRVYREWLKMYLSTPMTKLPASKYAKLARHEFRGRRWTWVDPANETQAAETARKWGWKTDTQIAAEMDQDYADNVDEIKRESSIVKGTVLESAQSQHGDANLAVVQAGKGTPAEAKGQKDAPKQDQTTQSQAGVDAENVLNGAQIEAAIEVFIQMEAGVLSDDAAQGLLVAVGIEPDEASGMIAAQKKKPKVKVQTDETKKQDANPKAA